MKLRILAINWEIIHDTATNARFTDAPAFSDYDAVVIDPSEIYSLLVQHAAKRTPEGSLAVNIDGDQGHTRSLIKFMERRAGEVLALLHKTRGVILTKAVPMDDVLILKGYDSYRRPVDQGSLSIYSWLPQISRCRDIIQKTSTRPVSDGFSRGGSLFLCGGTATSGRPECGGDCHR